LLRFHIAFCFTISEGVPSGTHKVYFLLALISGIDPATYGPKLWRYLNLVALEMFRDIESKLSTLVLLVTSSRVERAIQLCVSG
jgi:hypothetical protein